MIDFTPLTTSGIENHGRNAPLAPTISEISSPHGASHDTVATGLKKPTATAGEKGSAADLDCRRAKLTQELKNLSRNALAKAYPHEYNSWRNAKSRSRHGLTVTGPAWASELDQFAEFLKVLGPRPNPDDSIDRVDPDRGYVPGNVRWASKKLQSENRRNVHYELVNGIPMTSTDVAREFGLSASAVRAAKRRGQSYQQIADRGSAIRRIVTFPWPDCFGGRARWEASYEAERHNLPPSDRESRAAYLVWKTSAMLRAHLDRGEELWRESGEDENFVVPPRLRAMIEALKELQRYAWDQEELCRPPTQQPPGPLSPSQEEVEEICRHFGLDVSTA